MRQIIDGKYAIGLTKPSHPAAKRQLSLQKVVTNYGESANLTYEVMAVYESEAMLVIDLIRHHMGASILKGALMREKFDAEFIRLSELCDLALVSLRAGDYEFA